MIKSIQQTAFFRATLFSLFFIDMREKTSHLNTKYLRLIMKLISRVFLDQRNFTVDGASHVENK